MVQPLMDLAKGWMFRRGKGRQYTEVRRRVTLWGAVDERTCARVPQTEDRPHVYTQKSGVRWNPRSSSRRMGVNKFKFTGMLTQRHMTVLSNGKEVLGLHPVAFASKRISTIKEHYQP